MLTFAQGFTLWFRYDLNDMIKGVSVLSADIEFYYVRGCKIVEALKIV